MGAFRSPVRKQDCSDASSNGVGVIVAPSSEGALAKTGSLPKTDRCPGVPERRVSRILQRIQTLPCCSIHALALEFNLSTSRLQHLFKQQTGACLGHVLSERRLQQATYLLEHTNLRIKEIACTVGYEHTSSFDRAFERRFGYSPLVYRQTRWLARDRVG